MSIASDNNSLWIPQDIAELLTVSIDWGADESTVQGMLRVNQAASQWLTGQLDDYTYFELLDHHGIDPFGFVDEVEEHMALLMR